MKKLSLILLALLSIFWTACDDNSDGTVDYSSTNGLNFNKGVAKDVFVIEGTPYLDVELDYGVLIAATGSNTVKLVPTTTTTGTQAVNGVDYQIITDTDVLTDGEVGGKFKVRFFTDPSTQAGKVAAFKLESSSIPTAAFNNVFTFNVSLTCPVSTFVGAFSAATWWIGTSSHTISEGTATNSLIIENFWSDSSTDPDFDITYDPQSYVVTFADQDTGYFHPTYGTNIRAKMSTDATKVSSFNPCTRILKVWVNYYIPGVGTYGDKEEIFTGI